MDLSNLLNSVLGDERILQEMSRKVDAQPEDVRKAATLGVPTLVEALDRNARADGKRDGLARALEDHQNDDVENLEGFINHVDVEEGDRMVGHILGERKMNVENNIAKNTSLGIGQVSGLMSMLAPILIGMLANKKKEQNVSRDSIPDLTGSLGGLLGGSGGGGIMDIAKKMLDKDGDGSVMDDLLGKFF
ncbi:DUF937 domain-containing protein [Proteiniclasticum sp.]|uniref:DUF937 domain-containing protein n=1 Tax=Proteiniclasticum sp. TaxID=2053595 RepID=UPI00289C73A8|nr:DUF937 domain-containing protein [Proteiniclasticum sp.]